MTSRIGSSLWLSTASAMTHDLAWDHGREHSLPDLQGSRGLYSHFEAQNLSYRLKVNELDDLTTCEIASRCTGYKSNHVWSGSEALGKFMSTSAITLDAGN